MISVQLSDVHLRIAMRAYWRQKKSISAAKKRAMPGYVQPRVGRPLKDVFEPATLNQATTCKLADCEFIPSAVVFKVGDVEISGGMQV